MNKRKNIIWIILLALISLVLFVVNYKPGTYLVGWDVVMPELNFKANLWRNLQSVWQGYRGLGVEDGMAYAANLIHTLFTYLLSFILPNNVIRYFFHFFALFMGGVGIFLLLLKMRKRPALSFIGAVFYMLCPATIQMFFAPLEVFSVHFAALPWLVLTAINLFENKNKKNILLFFVANLLATPQGFVPTVFAAYLLVIGWLCFINLFRHGLKKISKILIIIAIIIASNSFWMLPFLHSALTQGEIIKNTKINQISSEEIYEKNRKRGDLFNILYQKGFMVDITENNLEGKLVYIMQDWNDWQNQPAIFALSTMFVLLLGTGLYKITSNLKNKKASDLEILSLTVFSTSVLFLGTNTPVLAQINAFIRNSLPLFGEAFRFPFTKFFLIYAFSYSLILIIGIQFIFDRFLKMRLYYWLFSFAVILISIPAFSGKFFYNVEKLKIPKEYFSVIDYFKSQDPKGRIMTLPQSSFWNWARYNWGYRGSGFLWYGIQQPMLERPFDPWSGFNEQYFNEVFYAIQSQMDQLFAQTVEKYNISYILLDGEIGNINKIQQKEKLLQLISNIYPSSERFDFGEITVVKLTDRLHESIKNSKIIGSEFQNENIDQAYIDNGDYRIGENWSVQYLFPSLFSNKTQVNTEYEAFYSDKEITIQPKTILIDNGKDKNIHLEALDSVERYFPAAIDIEDKILTFRPFNATLTINQTDYPIRFFEETSFNIGTSEIISISVNDSDIGFPKSNGFLLNSQLQNNITVETASGTRKLVFSPRSLPHDLRVAPTSNGENKIVFTFEQLSLSETESADNEKPNIENPCSDDIRNGLSLSDQDYDEITFESIYSTNCYNAFFYGIPQQAGTLFHLNSYNVSGEALKLYIDNPEQKSIVIETKLNGDNVEKSIIVPPTSPYFYSNYGLHIRNESQGIKKSSNVFDQKIKAFYFPYNWLKTIKLTSDNSSSEVYYLDQAFNPGWIAISNGKVLPHVKINNWANGWVLNGQTGDVKIVFWPQYLEYAGFTLLVITFLRILLIKEKHE